MTQITARIPDELAAQIDEAAARLRRSRAQLVRQAIEYYLDAMRRRDWADLPAETFTDVRFLRQFHLQLDRFLLLQQILYAIR